MKSYVHLLNISKTVSKIGILQAVCLNHFSKREKKLLKNLVKSVNIFVDEIFIKYTFDILVISQKIIVLDSRRFYQISTIYLYKHKKFKKKLITFSLIIEHLNYFKYFVFCKFLPN